jgi:uncharacterized protein (TIGR02145 family)
MKGTFFAGIILSVFTCSGFGQASISVDGSLPHGSAMLEIKSTSKGLLLPRMTTTEMKNIWKPAAGLIVFNTDSADFFGFNGTEWIAFFDNSDTISRFCPDSIYYGGQWYTAVQIGTQCWLAENLNVGEQVFSPAYPSNDGVIQKYCYLDSPDSCQVYGGLYMWVEMMDYNYTPGSQGICPENWHLPTNPEYDALAEFLGGEDVAGGKMKETGYRHWESPNTGATNSSGFTALGCGTYDPYYGWGFYVIRTYDGLWTSTPGGYGAYRRDLNHGDDNLSPYNCPIAIAFSVRCVKN